MHGAEVPEPLWLGQPRRLGAAGYLPITSTPEPLRMLFVHGHNAAPVLLPIEAAISHRSTVPGGLELLIPPEELDYYKGGIQNAPLR